MYSYFCTDELFYVEFFFFNDTATTEIYTLSLHDALPILDCRYARSLGDVVEALGDRARTTPPGGWVVGNGYDHTLLKERSEEHMSELQSRQYLVCRLLLEKKKYIMSHTLSLVRQTRLLHV